MLIIDFHGPPCWSRDANETGESTKCPWVGVINPTVSTQGHLVLYTEETNMAARPTQRSAFTISRNNRGLN